MPEPFAELALLLIITALASAGAALSVGGNTAIRTTVGASIATNASPKTPANVNPKTAPMAGKGTSRRVPPGATHSRWGSLSPGL